MSLFGYDDYDIGGGTTIDPHNTTVDMQNQKIINLANGTDSGDAVNKSQLNALSALYLPIDGSSAMTGSLNFGSSDYSISKTGTNLAISSLGSMFLNCGSTSTEQFSEISLTGSTCEIKNGAGNTNILLNNNINIDAGDGSITLNSGGTSPNEIVINNNNIVFNTTSSSSSFVFKASNASHVFLADKDNQNFTLSKQPSTATGVRQSCVEIRNDHSGGAPINFCTVGAEYDPNFIVNVTQNTSGRNFSVEDNDLMFGSSFKMYWDAGRLTMHDTNNGEDAMYLTAYEAVLPRRVTLRNPTPDDGSGGAGYALEATTSDTLTINYSNSFSGGVIMGSKMSMGSNKIENLATPTASNDAVTKAYADGLSHPLGSDHITTNRLFYTYSIGGIGNIQISGSPSTTNYYLIPSADEDLQYKIKIAIILNNNSLNTHGQYMTYNFNIWNGASWITYNYVNKTVAYHPTISTSDTLHFETIVDGSFLKNAPTSGGRQFQTVATMNGVAGDSLNINRINMIVEEIADSSYTGTAPASANNLKAQSSAYDYLQGSFIVTRSATEYT